MKTRQTINVFRKESGPERYYILSAGVFTLLTLIFKLSILNLNQAEYTDGIIQLNLWTSSVVFFPPGYSALVWCVSRWTGDLLQAGRLVSVLASVLTLPVFYCLAKEVLGREKEALWAMVLLALSPIFCRWSMRVMTDSLFCLFFVINLYQTFLAWNNSKRSLSALTGWMGLSVLVRYQGLFFVFPLLYLWVKRKAWQGKPINLRSLMGWFIAILPWLVLVYWISTRGFGHQSQFIERASQGLLNTLLAYYVMLETYLLYWPWAITYSLFGAGLLGIVSLWKAGNKERRFLGLTLFAFLVFLLVQAAFRSFQYRYLLPLLPLWCVCAGRGMGIVTESINQKWVRTSLVTLILLNLIMMTTAVLMLQRGAFGDLAQAAHYLQTIGTGSRVLSDEAYRSGVYNPKMQFWSGRKMDYYYLTKPQAGDLVVLHNAYSDFEMENKTLSKHFDLVVLRRWDSLSVPLLPDIMVMTIHPQKLPLTSNPECMAFRFFPQRYSTVLLRLNEKK